MKSTILFLSLICLGFVACEKKQDEPSINVNTLNSTITSGSWRVTYYWDTDHAETSNFSGYIFQFNADGTVRANKNTTVVNGTWSTRSDDSKIKLVLVFTSPAEFAELSDDWHTIELTATKIRLQDVSGGNGGTDYLTFERN